MGEPIIECRDLSHCYVRGDDRLTVLDHLDITVNKGDFVAIMGPSGSGKTTLLNLIGGLERASGGSIRVHGMELSRLSRASLAEWRASTIGFVFQFYNLLPTLTALGNVELPLLLTPLSKKMRRKRALLALSIVGLQDRAPHKPGELSGGQQQRVGIARALVADPELLVCDEPTGDLDRHTADDILMLLQTLNEEFAKTIIMVTHDPKAAEYARSVVQMDKGSLREIAA